MDGHFVKMQIQCFSRKCWQPSKLRHRRERSGTGVNIMLCGYRRAA